MSSASTNGDRAIASTAARAFEARPWGGFETIQEGPGYKVKRLVVKPGGRLSLQRHRFRAESWIVVTGSPRVIVSGRARRVRAREMVTVPKGAWHRIENRGRSPVIIIEVQHGPYLGEDDIIRRQDDYGRAGRDGVPSPDGAVPSRSLRDGAEAPSARSRPKCALGARSR